MDYKQLFGYAAILFGMGFFVRSFMPAYAFNGPNINTGSNPYFNFIDNGWNATLSSYSIGLSIPSNQAAIIEKIYITGSSYCSIALNGIEIDIDAITRLKVEPSDSLTLIKKSNSGSSYCGSGNSSFNKIYLEGYYAHL